MPDMFFLSLELTIIVFFLFRNKIYGFYHYIKAKYLLLVIKNIYVLSSPSKMTSP